MHHQRLTEMLRTSAKYGACVLLASLAAFFAVAVLKSNRTADNRERLEKDTEKTLLALSDYTIDSQVMGAVILAGLNQQGVKQAVLEGTRVDAAGTDIVDLLTPLRKQFGAEGVYIIDSNGKIVAHDTDGSNSTGANVGFRSYFTQAMRGKPSVYAAVGNNTGERGIYYAAPIHASMEKTSKAVGVVLAKLPGESIDTLLAGAGGTAVLLSPQKVVFASSRPDWLYGITAPASEARLEELRKLKQFGKYFDGKDPAILPFDPDADTVTIENVHYNVARRSVDWADPQGMWTVVSVSNIDKGMPFWLVSVVGIGTGGLTLLVAILVLFLLESRRGHQEDLNRFKFLATSLESSPVAVVLTDTQGLIRWVNPYFEKLTQFTLEEVSGKKPKVLSSGMTSKVLIRDLWETILSGLPWHGELINRKKDGSLFYSKSIITPVKAEDGTALGFVSIQEDVTTRKEAERAIKSAQAEMTQIFNTTAGGMRVIGADFTVLKVNDAFLELTGFTREELVGTKCHELFGGMDCGEQECTMQRILDGETRVETTVLKKRKDGTVMYCDIAATPFLSPEGEVLGAIEDFRDMTERMKAQHLIRQSESKYRELVESASSIILKLDMDGNVTFFNEFAQSFFGFGQDEIIGRPIVGTIVPENETGGRDLRALLGEIVQHCDRYGKNENENICKDGRRVWVSWTNQVIRDEATNQPRGLLCIGQDATERKKAQDGLHNAMEIISGSIRYASRIQRAILPAAQQFAELLPNHFTVWEPRDVVGGDMYWIRPWGQGVLLILADCTGHGVPGAFITLISSGALDRAILDVLPGDPAGLIGRMNKYVKVVLSQDLQYGQEESSDDGLELGVCYIPPGRDSITFAGAHFQLVTVIGGSVETVKGDRKGIGYRFVSYDAAFTNQTVPAAQGQRFYMTTDGLIDQIGGSPRRSFGKKRFASLLVALEDTPVEAHGAAIFEAVEQYRGLEARRDDIALIGFEL